MKTYFHCVLSFFILSFFCQQASATIIAGSSVTYTSPNPKTQAGVTETSMLKLSLSDVMNLYDFDEGGLFANAAGGEVRLRVYFYRPDVVDGKRMLLYEIYSNENADEYVAHAKSYNSANWPYSVIPIDDYYWGSSNWRSDDIGTAAMYAAQDNQSYYNCWDNWNTAPCGFSRGLGGHIIPVIVEITMHHASLSSFTIPGLDIVSPSQLAKVIPLNPVNIKGTNYEITNLEDNTIFGHSSNRYTISSVSKELFGKKITGLYDGGTSPDSYFKVIPTQTSTYVAVQIERSVSLIPELAEFNPVGFAYNAFKITKDGYTRTYHVYKLSGSNNHTLKFTADASGPFIIANDFDVSFKEDLALPAAKRKLFHRENWLNDVLVCAHRGLWSKVGSHKVPDFSGIAENTIPAYELAINDPNIDWIEFDARRTSDGVFVAWHDEGISRVSSFPDDQECIPVSDVNARDKLWRDEHQPEYSPANLSLKNKTWNFVKALHLRDYLGCKVKDSQGSFMHPLKLEDGFAWLAAQKALGKHSVISVDYKDGKNYIDEVYELILKYDLEGQVLLSVYAKDYSLADYQAEYGYDFLKQIPLKPTFYEPVNLTTDYGGNVLNRFNEYINAPEHFVAGFTLNVNYDKDSLLIAVLKQPGFASIANKVWYMSHYNEPFMASITDNNRLNSAADCDPEQHPLLQLCSNLFWRADFDWLLNNGTNAIFSDNTESLIEYLKAKGKK